jgi:hypothetical protein
MNIFKAAMYGVFSRKNHPTVNKILASKKIETKMFKKSLAIFYAVSALLQLISNFVDIPLNWIPSLWLVIYIIVILLIVTNGSLTGVYWDFEMCTVEQLADINEVSDLLDEYQQIDLFRMMDRKIGVL